MSPRWNLARLALLALHALGPLRHLRMDAWDYDEGPTLQAAALALHGARLYRDVPLNKPPLLVSWLHGVFALGGHGVAQGRLASLALGLLGLAALSSLATAWWGAGAGVVLLALALFVRDIPERLSVVMCDLPAVCAAGLALAFAWRARSSTGFRPWVLSGLALAAALALHPLVAGVLLPWALTVASLPVGSRRRAWVAPLVAIAAIAALLAPYEGPAMARWVVDYNRAHLGELSVDDSGATLRRWLREAWPWSIAAALSWAALLGARETRRTGVVSATWFAVTVLTLRAWRPLWENYRLWVELLLALPVAGALVQLRGRARLAWVAAPILAFTSPRPVWPRWSADRIAARAWIASQPQDTTVISDDPFLAMAAGRLVPPSLTDTSFKRIATGYLRLEDLRAAAANGPTVVVFATGRFDRLYGARAWCIFRAVATLRWGEISGYTLPAR